MAALGSCCSSTPLSSKSFRATTLQYSFRPLKLKPVRRQNLAIRAEVSFVTGDEAKELIAQGYTVLDVRDRFQFERAHIKSCFHVPLFIENKDNDIGTIVYRQLHNNFSGLFYGLPFTKPNPEFVQSVRNQFPQDSKLLLVCQEGLRSTAAADKLEKAGYENLACVVSGLQKVKPGTFDSVGSIELQDAGKAGLVTIQGKVSQILGAVLVSALVLITVSGSSREDLCIVPFKLASHDNIKYQ